ncbi:urease accessory protein UreE [Campylobacter corcagiensis]|uniref:Urease accessory protein UreE n=1 Tax=Campylobacter corcagiensis TaxID=1448857 RepID=A0A7M1LER7_9BACT|nr:urease accessory protein UreE [Campylobacter corcagiensis]QKF64764.1 urease accessory protein UreE [Campylobacter corcagiensis]QOQ87072.1 urease accessory protein UreE [Campylobacter corcagiensis]
MIVNKILGNLKDFDLSGKSGDNLGGNLSGKKIDFAQISNDDRLKKVLRVKSNSGTELGISVENELKNGDILAIFDDSVIIVEILPTDVLEIYPANLKEMGFLAHNIGNRHTPAIFEENLIIIEPDSVIEEFLTSQKAKFIKTKRVLKTALKHAEHSH